jgi:hypothetical protein
MNADYEIDVTLDLGALGLTHAEGSKCKCDGTEHPVRILIDPEAQGLHPDWDRLPEDDAQRALQALHVQAHPKGAVYVENCRETVCVDAMGLLL